MAWPKTRLRTMNTGVSPVNANDLNAIQDAIIAGSRGSFAIPIHASALAPNPTNMSYSTANGYALSSGSGEGNFPINGLTLGDIIESIDLLGFGNGVNNYVWALNKMTVGGVVSIPTGGNDTSVMAAAYTKRTVTLAAGGYVVAADEAYWIDWLPAATAMRLAWIIVKGYHP